MKEKEDFVRLRGIETNGRLQFSHQDQPAGRRIVRHEGLNCSNERRKNNEIRQKTIDAPVLPE